MSERWQNARAERSPNPAKMAEARAELQEFQATYDGYLEALGIPNDNHPEADAFNDRTREFEDGYGIPLEAAYRMAFLEMRVENLLDENFMLRREFGVTEDANR